MSLHLVKDKIRFVGFLASYIEEGGPKYINLSDLASASSQKAAKGTVVQNWLKAKDVIGMIRRAEVVQYGSTSIEFVSPFSMDVYKYSKSVIVRRGMAGGIYATEWIAFEFLKHLFPENIFSMTLDFEKSHSVSDKQATTFSEAEVLNKEGSKNKKVTPFIPSVVAEVDGVTVETILNESGFWLTQSEMAKLFGITNSTVSRHIKKVRAFFGEEKFSSFAQWLNLAENNHTGHKYTTIYSSDVVLAIGIRCGSSRAEALKSWILGHASSVASRGVSVDRHILENLPQEKKVNSLAILSMTREEILAQMDYQYLFNRVLAMAVDYKECDTNLYYAKATNKLLFASSGATATELIINRCDGTKKDAGLTFYKGDKPKKADLNSGRNFLEDKERAIMGKLMVIFMDIASVKLISSSDVTTKELIDCLDRAIVACEKSLIPQSHVSPSREKAYSHETKHWEIHKKCLAKKQDIYEIDFSCEED